MVTATEAPSLRPEKAGVRPNMLTANAAINGPSTTARTAIVAPSMTNTARICAEVAPRLQSKATSPPALLHGQRRQGGDVVEHDHGDEDQYHEHGQLAEEDAPVVFDQSMVQGGDLVVAGQQSGEPELHRPHAGVGGLGVAGVDAVRIDGQEPGVLAVHASERRSQYLCVSVFRNVEGHRIEAGSGCGVEHGFVQIPYLGGRIVLPYDP